jgi:hypothetical protein
MIKVETTNNNSPGDLVRYGSIIGVVVRPVSPGEPAWESQTFGVDATWILWSDNSELGWVYDKDLKIISPINKRD